MSPLTHFIASWLVASAATDKPRDRTLITLAGVAPDLDGLGLVADMGKAILSSQPNNFHFYQTYHHELCHGWPGALVVSALLACFARQRGRAFLLCLVTFHLHLLCDLVGSRGPTLGDIWPILYSEPVFRHPVWFLKWQWRLDGWQNQVIFVIVFVTALWRSVRLGSSFVGVFSRKGDEVFIRVLQKWSGAFRAWLARF